MIFNKINRLIKIMFIVSIIFSIEATAGYGYGDSSGGSRGMTTSNVDPYSNIAKHETIERNLIVNQSIEYSFTTPEFSIYQILAINKINDFDVPIMIEELKNSSEYGNGLVEPAPGIVYRNENVWLGSDRIKYISIRFRVENSWIEGLGDGRLPYLLKYNGTGWSVLKTNMTGKDISYTYFEAPKAGNSRIGIFAISSPLKGIQTVNMAPKDILPADTEQYEVVTPSIEEMGAKNNKGTLGFEVIIVIIGVILLVVFAVRKKM